MRVHLEKGLEPPDFIINAPVLFEGGERYLNAFRLLNEGRISSGMGAICALSLAEIHALFQIYDICDKQERDDYVFFLRALDRVYVTHENERLSREAERLNKQQQKRK